MEILLVRIIRAWSAAAVALASAVHAAPQLAVPIVRNNGAVELRISGSASDPMALQASPDLRSWSTLQTFTLDGSEVVYVDSQPGTATKRFYRLASVAAPLPDLQLLANRVFVPGEGFDTVQFASSGRLGLIAWMDRDLIYRERDTGGSWTEAVVSQAGKLFAPLDREEFRFQPLATLLFDSNSQPHVMWLAGARIRHAWRNSAGAWQTEDIVPSGAGSSFALFTAAIGAGDKLHIALINDDGVAQVTHGSNASGAWKWSRAASINGDPRYYLYLWQSYAPRFFSIAVDSRNAAHIAFTPEFKLPVIGGYVRPNSELAYVSNASGDWRTTILHGPSDGSGDAGLGASIAIGPDDQPAIASWYDERASTGSAQWSQFLYHKRNANGTWTKTILPSSPDGYVAGDGQRGTGFAPYLRFDGRGRPHVLFSDHASQHFPASGQNEYAGQVRHAYFDGSKWVLKTLLRQSDPLKSQIVFPAFAMSGSELVTVALERRTEWAQPDTYLRPVASQYQWRIHSSVLP